MSTGALRQQPVVNFIINQETLHMNTMTEHYKNLKDAVNLHGIGGISCWQQSAISKQYKKMCRGSEFV